MKTLIVTEGTKTEPQYFKGLVEHLRATATDVRRAPAASISGVGPGPSRALDRALELRDQEASRDRPFDQVWIVFDVDEHTSIEETLRRARRESIRVAITNPCFELWLLLHFEDCNADVTGRAISKRLEAYGVTTKDMPESFDYARYSNALDRRQTELNAAGIPVNPGETVSALVRSLVP